jgi:hypothetical protein
MTTACTTHETCPFRPGTCPGPTISFLDAPAGIYALEHEVLDCATTLSEAEDELAQEYLLLMAGGKYQTWQAQKMAEFKRLGAVTLARAHLEIALARLKRA